MGVLNADGTCRVADRDIFLVKGLCISLLHVQMKYTLLKDALRCHRRAFFLKKKKIQSFTKGSLW